MGVMQNSGTLKDHCYFEISAIVMWGIAILFKPHIADIAEN